MWTSVLLYCLVCFESFRNPASSYNVYWSNWDRKSTAKEKKTTRNYFWDFLTQTSWSFRLKSYTRQVKDEAAWSPALIAPSHGCHGDPYPKPPPPPTFYSRDIYNRELSLSHAVGYLSLRCLFKPFWFHQQHLCTSPHNCFLLALCTQSSPLRAKPLQAVNWLFWLRMTYPASILLYNEQLDVAHPY